MESYKEGAEVWSEGFEIRVREFGEGKWELIRTNKDAGVANTKRDARGGKQRAKINDDKSDTVLKDKYPSSRGERLVGSINRALYSRHLDTEDLQ